MLYVKLILEYDSVTNIMSLVTETGEVIEDVVSLSWDLSMSDHTIVVLKNTPLTKSLIVDPDDIKKALITTKEWLIEEKSGKSESLDSID